MNLKMSVIYRKEAFHPRLAGRSYVFALIASNVHPHLLLCPQHLTTPLISHSVVMRHFVNS